jgi:Skp family chaperone for outer membrane proteins
MRGRRALPSGRLARLGATPHFRHGLLAALVLGAAAASATVALAQEAGGAAARTPKIAVIDLFRISNESQLGRSYAARIEALETEIKNEGTKKQAELNKLDAAIKTLQDELEKQASVLSAEAADRKRQEITRKGRERQAFLEDGQAELQRMRERAQAQAESLNNEFQQKLKPFIDAAAKDRGVDILLNSQVVLTASREFDISPDVIARADAASKAGAAAPGAAAATPAPPAGAAAPPAAGAPAAPRPTPTPTPQPQQ